MKITEHIHDDDSLGKTLWNWWLHDRSYSHPKVKLSMIQNLCIMNTATLVLWTHNRSATPFLIWVCPSFQIPCDSISCSAQIYLRQYSFLRVKWLAFSLLSCHWPPVMTTECFTKDPNVWAYWLGSFQFLMGLFICALSKVVTLERSPS